LLAVVVFPAVLCAVTGLGTAAVAAPPDEGIVDAGVITISLLGREVGRERYALRRTDDGLLLDDTFSFVDRGGEVGLETTLELSSDLTPRRLQATGRTYRFLEVEVDVEVEKGVATVNNLGATRTVQLPSRFFTVPGYAPLAARALLIGYWECHGRPDPLAVVPGAPTTEVFISARGSDVVRLGDASVTLRRYLVRGVAWGREVVWLDADGRLAAIFTRANILPLDGIRDDLAPARARLEALAVTEYMSELERLSRAVEPLAAGDFALVGARLVDGTGAAAIEDAVVVVRDGRIAAAGPWAETPVPDDVRRIDARGTSIVPGLWDMHAHAAQIEWAPAYLAAGVTTVRDMGGGFAFLTAFRDALESGRGIGPRLLLAGLVDGKDDNAFGAVTAGTPAEGRAVVDRYHEAGFQQMKLYTYVQPDVVRAIAARAHEVGMTVTGHVPRGLSVSEALDAGMDQVAHLPVRGDPTTPEARLTIEALRTHHAAVDPTVSWGELLGRSRQTPIAEFQPGILAAPWPIAAAYGSVRNEVTPEEAAARVNAALAGVRALHEAGVPLLAGTDYGVPAHSLHRELELYVAAGFTPLQALQTATAVPARVMGLDGDSGTIEKGKRADMLVLDGDPLTDISALRRGRWVVADGVMYDCEALWALADFAPSSGPAAAAPAPQSGP
jgi:imidazolonepropionase-like amidohydrolase